MRRRLSMTRRSTLRFGRGLANVYIVELPPELAAVRLAERIDRLHGNYRVGPNGELRVVDEESVG